MEHCKITLHRLVQLSHSFFVEFVSSQVETAHVCVTFNDSRKVEEGFLSEIIVREIKLLETLHLEVGCRFVTETILPNVAVLFFLMLLDDHCNEQTGSIIELICCKVDLFKINIRS